MPSLDFYDSQQILTFIFSSTYSSVEIYNPAIDKKNKIEKLKS